MASHSRNFNVKRIIKEIKEIQNDDTLDFVAEALPDNIFEWHFVLRGPPETDFQGGVYHGRIHLPAEYPLKAPELRFLTPNGRFQTNVRICLSITSYHPESWSPSWTIRTALVALVAFMPQNSPGSIGALSCSPAARQKYARDSVAYIPMQDSSESAQLALDLHHKLLARLKHAPLECATTATSVSATSASATSAGVATEPRERVLDDSARLEAEQKGDKSAGGGGGTRESGGGGHGSEDQQGGALRNRVHGGGNCGVAVSRSRRQAVRQSEVDSTGAARVSELTWTAVGLALLLGVMVVRKMVVGGLVEGDDAVM